MRAGEVAFSYVVTSSSSCGLESLYGVTVVAVNHAVDYVNSNVNLLSGINLSHEAVKFTKVSDKKGCMLVCWFWFILEYKINKRQKFLRKESLGKFRGRGRLLHSGSSS